MIALKVYTDLNFAALPSNSLVRSRRWQIRVVHDIDGVVVVVCGKYRCINPDCKSNIDSAQASAKKAEASGGKKVSEIEWDAEAVRSYCKHGVSFNTMDERYAGIIKLTSMWTRRTREAKSTCVRYLTCFKSHALV